MNSSPDTIGETAGTKASRWPSQQLRVVVVTKNSARWFGNILDWYRAQDISPFVILDRSSDDLTEELLLRKGVEYVKGSSEFPRVESMIALIPDYVPSRWVLRLDDDEIPSSGLCSWIDSRLTWLDKFSAIGFQRRWIRLAPDGRCEYSRHRLIVSSLGVLDAQWRLYRPAAVKYRSDIHTPGFYVPKGNPIAPNRAYIAHLSWLVRSAQERRLQVEDYDRQQPEAGSRFRALKVWEDCKLADHDFHAMETDEFNGIAARLAATTA
jgi:hypothetical protein